MSKVKQILFLLLLIPGFVQGVDFIRNINPFLQLLKEHGLDAYESGCHFPCDEHGVAYSLEYQNLSVLEKKMNICSMTQNIREEVRNSCRDLVREIIGKFVAQSFTYSDYALMKNIFESFAQQPHAADIFSCILKNLLIRDDIKIKRKALSISFFSELLHKALVADGQRMADAFKLFLNQHQISLSALKKNRALCNVLTSHSVGSIEVGRWFQHAAAYMLCYGKERKIRKQLAYQEKNYNGVKAIHMITCKEILALMLEKGVPVDTPSPRGYTPLMAFSASHNFEAVAILLHSGANVNTSVRYDPDICVTPLVLAVSRHIVYGTYPGQYCHAEAACSIVGAVTCLLFYRGAEITPLAMTYACCSRCPLVMQLFGILNIVPR